MNSEAIRYGTVLTPDADGSNKTGGGDGTVSANSAAYAQKCCSELCRNRVRSPPHR